ncbi:MAG: hypothetical protein V3U76_17510 [Granulosicoccus sp.]
MSVEICAAETHTRTVFPDEIGCKKCDSLAAEPKRDAAVGLVLIYLLIKARMVWQDRRDQSAQQAFKVLPGQLAATVVADGGYHAINSACQSDFGANARIATSREVLDASGLIAQTGFAWVEKARDSDSVRDSTTGISPTYTSCQG